MGGREWVRSDPLWTGELAAERLEMVQKEGDQLKVPRLEGGGTGNHTVEKMKNSSPSRTEANG